MQLDYDYIICGGGISGLLLSTKLSQDPNQSKKSILLIDPVFQKLKTIGLYAFGTIRIRFGMKS